MLVFQIYLYVHVSYIRKIKDNLIILFLVCDPWPNYSACSSSCGGGIQYRERNCSHTDGNNVNIIPQSESHVCNLNPCPSSKKHFNVSI